MAFAALADFQARYDSRLIAQLSEDANTGTVNSANVTVLLADAYSMILAAVLRGSIYTTAQLVATGDTMLVRLNCDVALKLLCARRAGGIPQAVQDIIKAANDMLSALESGGKVLNIAANRTADTPSVVISTRLQRQNLGDITANPFWSNDLGTNTVDAPGT